MSAEDIRNKPHCGACMAEVPPDETRCACGSRLILGVPDKHSRKFDLFTPFELEGKKFDTKAEWDTHRRTVAEIHGVPVENIALMDNSRPDRNRRYEEAQHRRYEKLQQARRR